MPYDQIAHPDGPPFDWDRMNQFWEEALNRFKACVEAEELRDKRSSDAV